MYYVCFEKGCYFRSLWSTGHRKLTAVWMSIESALHGVVLVIYCKFGLHGSSVLGGSQEERNRQLDRKTEREKYRNRQVPKHTHRDQKKKKRIRSAEWYNGTTMQSISNRQEVGRRLAILKLICCFPILTGGQQVSWLGSSFNYFPSIHFCVCGRPVVAACRGDSCSMAGVVQTDSSATFNRRDKLMKLSGFSSAANRKKPQKICFCVRNFCSIFWGQLQRIYRIVCCPFLLEGAFHVRNFELSSSF